MGLAWKNCHSVGVNTNCKSCFFEARKLCFFKINFFKFIYSSREKENGGGAEREGERESQAGSVLSMQSLMQGSIPWTSRSWPEPKPTVWLLTDWATQTPCFCFCFWWVFWLYYMWTRVWGSERRKHDLERRKMAVTVKGRGQPAKMSLPVEVGFARPAFSWTI